MPIPLMLLITILAWMLMLFLDLFRGIAKFVDTENLSKVVLMAINFQE